MDSNIAHRTSDFEFFSKLLELLKETRIILPRHQAQPVEKILDESTIDLKKIKMAHGGKRPGAGRKRGSQDDPKRALVKAVDRIAAELAIAITGDVKALGRERLIELDNMAMQLVKLFAPKKDAQGNVHWGAGDEARFYRCAAMATSRRKQQR